jgi:hypothetical protein
MSDGRRQHKLLLLWGVVPVIAVLELVFQWLIPRRVPSAEDWEAAARAVADEKERDDLVVIVPDWASQGRMYFKDLISKRDFGRFDTTTYRHLFVVSAHGAEAKEADGLEPEHTVHFGNLEVCRYALPKKQRVVYDFSEHLEDATFSGKGPLTEGLTIDHAFIPREVLRVPLSPRRSTVTFEDVPLKGTLYGYGVIGTKDYRASNYDEGGPVEISIYIDGKKRGALSIANFDPPRRFELPLVSGGRGTVRFEIRSDSAVNRELGLAVDVREKARRGS